MDKRDQLLKLLEKDSRLTVADLSAILDMPESEVSHLLEELEQDRVIVGYHTLINWEKTDNEQVEAMIEVKVNPQKGKGFDLIAEKLYQFDQVQAVYLMSGGYDFTVSLKKGPMREIARFVSSQLSTIEEVQSTTTHVILKKYKDHGTLFVDKGKDKRMAVKQ